MLSGRTRGLLLVLIAFTFALAIVVHRRKALCATVPHGFARRAPIAGASGTDTFVCSAMYQRMPLTDKLISGGWALALLALLRSVLIDRHERLISIQSRDLY